MASALDDVAVTAATPAEDGFDARRDAISRSYRYRVLTRRAPARSSRPGPLVAPPNGSQALDACAAALAGNHDFTAFTPPKPTTSTSTATSSTPIGQRRRHLVFRITADAFMRNMVRVLVGTMLEVASGRRTLEDFSGSSRAPPAPQPAKQLPPRPVPRVVCYD